MKYNIFDQLARPEVDVMLFNEHGSPDKQHISAEGEPETFEARAEALRSEIYYMLAREKRKPDGDVAGAVEYFKEMISPHRQILRGVSSLPPRRGRRAARAISRSTI